MKFAVGFKTHVWDPFVDRQFGRYRSRLEQGDLFALADDTQGELQVPDGVQTVRTTNAQLLDMGFANAYGKGGLIWWNTDYPHYAFQKAHPDYDYYLFVEYDTVINRDIDALMAEVMARRLDYVALPVRQDLSTWYWTGFHEKTYPREDIRGALNCICILSNRAITLLEQRRLELSARHAAGEITCWPMYEVFMATELDRAGYKFASIEEFGDCSHYEWFPPHLEDDLPKLGHRTFIHPLLDRDRYIRSLLKFEFDLTAYFRPRSRLRRHLSRFPAQDYVPYLPAAFSRQLTDKIRQKLGHI